VRSRTPSCVLEPEAAPHEAVRSNATGRWSLPSHLCLRKGRHHPVDERDISTQELRRRVAVLQQNPTRPYREIAELRIGDTSLSFGSLQRKILSRAATLGADAVVFDKPQTQTTHEIAYEPVYNPWGYYSPYYGSPWGYGGGYGGPFGGWGPWGGMYSGSVAVPYDETIRMLKGTAIRYTETANVNDLKTDQ